jgi:hypothetical protein
MKILAGLQDNLWTVLIKYRLVELLNDATVQMKDLKRQQLELQEEIKIKENTIYIGNVLAYQGSNSQKQALIY